MNETPGASAPLPASHPAAQKRRIEKKKAEAAEVATSAPGPIALGSEPPTPEQGVVSEATPNPFETKFPLSAGTVREALPLAPVAPAEPLDPGCGGDVVSDMPAARPAAAGRAPDQDLDEFVELFDDVAAGVYSDNVKRGWWEDPEANEAKAALAGLAAASECNLVPDDLHPSFVGAIDALGSVAKKLADRTPRNDFEALFLMGTELAEAGESRRHGLAVPDDKIPEFSGIEAELADVVIRIMDMSAARGWRVAEALRAKVKFNRTREFRHGGKLA